MGAVIIGPYRYYLTRSWDLNGSFVTFVGLNPSTADAENDDATVRRLIGFAKAWGHGGFYLVNLFAYRSTDPKKLHEVEDPVGEDNDRYVDLCCDASTCIVACWGAGGSLLGRGDEVRSRLQNLHHLGLTKQGFPRHPLYLRKDTLPTPWETP